MILTHIGSDDAADVDSDEAPLRADIGPDKRYQYSLEPQTLEGRMNWAQILEDAIVGKLIGALLDDGYRIEISDQDGGGTFVYAATDGGEKPADGYDYWVKLRPGNGSSVICDYSTNLETTIKPVNDFAAHFPD